MPPRDIKALGVQLPSQPPLPPGEQELGRCLLLLWLEISTNAAALLGRDFHMVPFSLPVSRSILIPCSSALRRQADFWLAVLLIHRRVYKRERGWNTGWFTCLLGLTDS